MKDRILEFLKAENKSSAQFAEEIGVQPSGISHILSGRNNPSLDFVLKMLSRYKFLSTEWLLFGKGTMYKDSGGMKSLFEQTLFDQKSEQIENKVDPNIIKVTDTEEIPDERKENRNYEPVKEKENTRYSDVEKIVWFYSDGSFEEYYPRN